MSKFDNIVYCNVIGSGGSGKSAYFRLLESGYSCRDHLNQGWKNPEDNELYRYSINTNKGYIHIIFKVNPTNILSQRDNEYNIIFINTVRDLDKILLPAINYYSNIIPKTMIVK